MPHRRPPYVRRVSFDDPTLFDPGGFGPDAPLAVRMRPRTLDEVVGQDHLVGEGTPLRRLVDGDAVTSLLLWGPPGSGKTTLAYVVSKVTGRHYRELSAVSAGVRDVRAVVDEARAAVRGTGRRTVLFLDEVHRFSKAQQDVLLPAVENGWLTLIAATTENPSFSVIGPLMSRLLLLRLQPLTDEQVRVVVHGALADERGYGGQLRLTPEAEQHLLSIAGGDARRALTALEATGLAAGVVDLSVLEAAVDRAAVRYDRDGDLHYEVASAFIKSLRGSDVDASLHYLARMLEAGEDPRFVARRMVILASEDVGMADPGALQVAVAAAHALELVGLPEARLNLAQAAVHLALAPKSNAVYRAYESAAADVRAGRSGLVPRHLRDASYATARRYGHGRGYRYPHDDPAGVLRQEYLPEQLRDVTYYRPSTHGAEAAAWQRWERLRPAVRGVAEEPPAAGPGSAGPTAE
jgi:putative ATPase